MIYENKDIYALEEVTMYSEKENILLGLTANIFLAGPTPREEHVASWRPEAINILRDLGYKGNIVIPEPRNGKWTLNYDSQVDWELQSIFNSGNILFWIPRNMETMPGMTTNVEFGYVVGLKNMCEDPGFYQISAGFPENTPHTRYLSGLLRYHSYEPASSSLEETCKKMIKCINKLIF